MSMQFKNCFTVAFGKQVDCLRCQYVVIFCTAICAILIYFMQNLGSSFLAPFRLLYTFSAMPLRPLKALLQTFYPITSFSHFRPDGLGRTLSRAIP